MINKEFHKTKTDIKSELQEIEEAKKNPKKFEILYNRYHEQIFRYLYSRVDNTHLAADLTSQVFYKALLNIENYSFKGVPFASWLYRIAYNEMNMHFRKDSKNRTVNIESDHIGGLFEELEEDYYSEEKEKLVKILATLSDERLSIIEMRFFEKRSFKEIAEIMGITENNAKVKVYRTLDKLKKNFNIRA
ncbi:MAG: RNA polymerase sigma factor [Flavobacteriales bacterium]|tara:strand:+ start:292 stop:861 length:570 start_codon:yes stop_codon:yes gene_type:complete